jgi:hypothetical protein
MKATRRLSVNRMVLFTGPADERFCVASLHILAD